MYVKRQVCLSKILWTLILSGLALLLVVNEASGEAGGANSSPTLARLSFWVPPDRMSEFEAAYQEKVVPILKKHGLVESAVKGRATPDSVFSRLFEAKTAIEFLEKKRGKALRSDPARLEVYRELGTAFGTTRPDGQIRGTFRLYTAPAGPGKVGVIDPDKAVPAGRGKGHWQTYDETDGLAFRSILSMLQDRDGNLWFGTNRGVSRYEGQTWTTFTTEDGLGHNYVPSILLDRGGNLWFGTWAGGVSRYDPGASPGQAWSTFTTEDGLAHNRVRSILQDREGNFWFGTVGGVTRYDPGSEAGTGPGASPGQAWSTFTTEGGLGHNNVTSILQDRGGNLWFGTWAGGVSRYDPGASPGQAWSTFTTEDGLAHNRVSSILQDREGNFWFGTVGGVTRYDPGASPGRDWTTFTTAGLGGQSLVWHSWWWREPLRPRGKSGTGLGHVHHRRWSGRQLGVVPPAGSIRTHLDWHRRRREPI